LFFLFVAVDDSLEEEEDKKLIWLNFPTLGRVISIEIVV